jgi:DNA (cytosine-5)-methyltransferase 1
MPKFLLNTSEFEPLRKKLANLKIDAILDFGEKGFSGVLVETIGIFVSTSGKPSFTKVISTTENIEIIQKQSYITDKKFPYWIIYRNRTFDKVSKNMQFGIFDVFRDRQITNSLLNTKGAGYRVIKSRNIPDFGQDLIAIKGYDSFIDKKKAKNLAVFEYLDNEKVYISPNMTYKPRVIKKPAGTLVNGSAAILILKPSEKARTKAQMEYFSSQEYRDFYVIARNRQTRSLNIDSSSVFFFGRLKAEK